LFGLLDPGGKMLAASGADQFGEAAGQVPDRG
jgi:hypothetical protein